MIFAFDRDFTVDCAEDPGPVPLDWIKELARSYPVYAVGNPKLGVEAGIPDKREVKAQLADLAIPMPEVNLDHLDQLPMIARQKLSPESVRRNAEGKVAALWRLSALYPDDAEVDRLVIDDIDLSTMPGWIWVSPDEFVRMGLDFWP